MSLRTAKARNCLFSQRLREGQRRRPRLPPCFRAVVPIWGDNRGDSRVKPSNPHKFPCSASPGIRLDACPFAGLQRAGWPAGCPILSSWPGLTRPFTSLATRSPDRTSLVRGWTRSKLRLLQVHLRASLFELGLDLVGFFLVDAFLDVLRRALDEVLGFLQAETGDGADFLDDLDLLVAGSRENNRELGLLFSRGSSAAASAGSRGNSDRGRGRDAPLFFQVLCEYDGFEHGEAREVVDDFLQVSH